MCRHYELRFARQYSRGHVSQKSQLALRRQCRFWLVEQEETGLNTILQNCQERLSVRPVVQRTTTVPGIGIAIWPEVRIRIARIEKRSEVCLEFGAQEIAVWRTA